VSDRYPALRAFARAYLHQDFEPEHGTPEAALEAFLGVATAAERRTLGGEAVRLDRRIAGWPVARVRALLQDELGCAWWPARTRNVRSLLAAAARAPSRPASK
jgi:hypothetical protein